MFHEHSKFVTVHIALASAIVENIRIQAEFRFENLMRLILPSEFTTITVELVLLNENFLPPSSRNLNVTLRLPQILIREVTFQLCGLFFHSSVGRVCEREQSPCGPGSVRKCSRVPCHKHMLT